MAIRQARFRCTGVPNDTMVREQIAALHGVTAWVMEPQSAGIIVKWEDTQVTPLRVELVFNAIGYQKI